MNPYSVTEGVGSVSGVLLNEVGSKVPGQGVRACIRARVYIR
ncbi:MAG: hypothetical protein ACI4HQ_13290 [Acetatifactor sp.]